MAHVHPPALKIAWRIMLALYDTEASFAIFRQTLAQQRDLVDEIAFFDSPTHHLYFSLDYQAERAALLARRVAALKADGVPSVGINVLCTIGHIDEAWDYLSPLPFQPLVGHDGRVARTVGGTEPADAGRVVARGARGHCRGEP